MLVSKLPHRFRSVLVLVAVAISVSNLASVSAQNPQRSPSETVREFYKAMRERRFRDAFALSIYKPAIESLSLQEYNELVPDFEKTAIAVAERIPENLQFTGEQISEDSATVFLKVLDTEGKEKLELATLIKDNNIWILGDRENQQLVKKAGKRFFFDARIDAHHNDVQDMLTRISLAQVVYSQQHAGEFADLTTLISSGLVPKDIEGTGSTGYRFRVTVTANRKGWSAAAEPAEYGRSGKLSFFLDSTGVRSGDVGGKPLPSSPIKN